MNGIGVSLCSVLVLEAVGVLVAFLADLSVSVEGRLEGDDYLIVGVELIARESLLGADSYIEAVSGGLYGEVGSSSAAAVLLEGYGYGVGLEGEALLHLIGDSVSGELTCLLVALCSLYGTGHVGSELEGNVLTDSGDVIHAVGVVAVEDLLGNLGNNLSLGSEVDGLGIGAARSGNPSAVLEVRNGDHAVLNLGACGNSRGRDVTDVVNACLKTGDSLCAGVGAVSPLACRNIVELIPVDGVADAEDFLRARDAALVEGGDDRVIVG